MSRYKESQSGTRQFNKFMLATVILIGGAASWAVNCRGPETVLEDGITFEEDGTAVAGRESGEGWLDIQCGSTGRVTVIIVNAQGWKIVDEGSFSHEACEDKGLEPGEITLDEIPERLRD